MKFSPKGIIAAMVTPFTKGGDYVDFDKVAPLAAALVKRGAHGLFPCGTTGEGMLMNAEERKTVLEEVLMAVGKRALVVAHTGALDTATTIELTVHAMESGAQAAAIVAPSYYAYDRPSLVQFYTSIAKEVEGFPVLLYNIPSCARNALDANLVFEIAHSVENVVGIKDSSGNMPLITQLLARAPKGFSVINGEDEYGYQAFVAGAPAAVSGTANVVLDLYLGVYNEVQKGNLKKAWAWQAKLAHACGLFAYGGTLAAFKEGMRLRGLDGGYVRPPQRELTAQEKKQLAKALEAAGLL